MDMGKKDQLDLILTNPLVNYLAALDGGWAEARQYCNTHNINFDKYVDETKISIAKQHNISLEKKEISTKKPELGKINSLKNYGLTIKGLEELTLSVVRTAFYGAKNISIPKEAKQKMNPAEIIAVYFGAEPSKNFPNCFSELKRKTENMNAKEKMKAIVASLNEVAYNPDMGNASFLRYSIISPKVFTIAHGDEQKRIDSLEESVCKEFVSSFEKPFIAPNHGDGGTYHDPGWEGGGIGLSYTKDAKRGYIKGIIKEASRD